MPSPKSPRSLMEVLEGIQRGRRFAVPHSHYLAIQCGLRHYAARLVHAER